MTTKRKFIQTVMHVFLLAFVFCSLAANEACQKQIILDPKTNKENRSSAAASVSSASSTSSKSSTSYSSHSSSSRISSSSSTEDYSEESSSEESSEEEESSLSSVSSSKSSVQSSSSAAKSSSSNSSAAISSSSGSAGSSSSSGAKGLDSDLDDLVDEDEEIAGTKVYHPDSDKDGLTDGFEYENGIDPLDNSDPDSRRLALKRDQALANADDIDGDGLSNIVEDELKTYSNKADSDGDNIPDGIEVINGTNPRRTTVDFGQDSDNDGLTDELEATIGTDPAKADTDLDSLSDAYDWLLGFDPRDPDTDGDGILDGFEFPPFDYRIKNDLWHF
ncbi:MAG: hypothetical protein IT292_11395 [Deltaproteobacteria bacterium]|nr:hypothetical protein [Deltaproteobacteria bacterium]